eukprot:1485498-Pyramimonas_sp.AAC.1
MLRILLGAAVARRLQQLRAFSPLLGYPSRTCGGKRPRPPARASLRARSCDGERRPAAGVAAFTSSARISEQDM